MSHKFYSQRKGTNPNLNGLPLETIIELFLRTYSNLVEDGYFDEAFGFFCVDMGDVKGKVKDVDLEVLISVRKEDIWPIQTYAHNYSEDDLFDMIEFLYLHVSKPIDGNYHSWNDCGMHWETFNKLEGQVEFIKKINSILEMYSEPYVLSKSGEILHKVEKGFEKIFAAEVPTKEPTIQNRIDAAVNKYRRHNSSIDDRRQAVRDLADVLEFLRPQAKLLISNKDESDLFNIANNFGIRHLNEKQKTNYDAAIWLSWMFYIFLSTIHVLLRKINQTEES